MAESIPSEFSFIGRVDRSTLMATAALSPLTRVSINSHRRLSSSSAPLISGSCTTRFFWASAKSTLHLSSLASSSSSSSVSSASSPSSLSSPVEALIFDCDGVILESEHLHRQAYNDAFLHFRICCPASNGPLEWSSDFYDDLQNRIGGGKPKMRWYFNEHGWPSSLILAAPPSDDKEKEKLIDTLQDWKTKRYKEILSSGTVKPRPGVLRLMDDAKAAGIKVAVCSAATKSSVVFCLENLIGIERFQALDCFLAGDDVEEKKPHPSIYLTAAKKLNVHARNCLVVEDSVIGLKAATKAGMSCIITYTSSTSNQDFRDAIATYPDLTDVRFEELELLLHNNI